MRKYIFALLFIALGLLIMIVPQHIFPVCDHGVETVKGMMIPMACHWSAQAEIGVGLCVIAGGLFIACSWSPAFMAGVTLMLMPLGALTIGVPVWLIGMCKNPMMPCRIATEPALIVLGSALIALAAVFLLVLFSGHKKAQKDEEILKYNRDISTNKDTPSDKVKR